jgi:hypothetical protein
MNSRLKKLWFSESRHWKRAIQGHSGDCSWGNDSLNETLLNWLNFPKADHWISDASEIFWRLDGSQSNQFQCVQFSMTFKKVKSLLIRQCQSHYKGDWMTHRVIHAKCGIIRINSGWFSNFSSGVVGHLRSPDSWNVPFVFSNQFVAWSVCIRS